MANNTYWPGWETVRLIGRGSFGAVYEIQRDVLGEVEKAALKVISIPQNASDIDEMYSDGYDDESITSTFQSHLKSIVAEYSLMRKMNGCTNIVNCDDIRYVQHDDGIGWDIFIKMELLTPLTKALPAQISEETVIKIARDLCVALELCKKHDIVHRDIKPQNIFVSPNGDYKLGDFGIAKTVEKTMGGTKIGTYKYMAPEVYNNQPYGTGADIYSLGLVLYWLLNERRMPFLPLPPAKMSSTMEDTARHRRFEGEPLPAPAHGSAELKRIVLKACAYDPKDRYQTATEMLMDLQGVGYGSTFFVTVPQTTADHRAQEEAEAKRRQQEEWERIRREREEQERQRREREEQERLRREREEQERLRREREEQERLRREREEQERLRREREEQERIRREREEQERIRREREEQERLRREREEQERVRREREEQERLRREREEQERIRREREEQERIRREQEEQERRRRERQAEEARRRNMTEQERIRREQEEQERIRRERQAEEARRRHREAERNAHLPEESPASELAEEKKSSKRAWIIPVVCVAVLVVIILLCNFCTQNTRIKFVELACVPYKTTYNVGDVLDTQGMRLSIYFSDGIVAQMEHGDCLSFCSPQLLNTPGSQIITVNLDGHICTFEVEVKPVENLVNPQSPHSHNWITLKENPFKASIIQCMKFPYEAGSNTSRKEATVNANVILQEFISSEKTSAAFEVLAKENADIVHYYTGSIFAWRDEENLSDWCAEEGRAAGDIGIIELADTMVLVRFVRSAVYQMMGNDCKYCSICHATSGEVSEINDDFFDALRGTGSAGYPGRTKVNYQYYDGNHYYAADNVLYVSNIASGNGGEIFRSSYEEISDLCIVDGYIFFNERASNGKYHISAITLDGKGYRVVLDGKFGYIGCFYLDGWIYTEQLGDGGRVTVRIKPGDPNSLQFVGNGYLYACDVDEKSMWLLNAYQGGYKFTKIDLRSMETLFTIDATSYNDGYAYDGTLYARITSEDITGEEGIRSFWRGRNFALVGDKIVCTEESSFGIMDRNGSLDAYDETISVHCNVAISINSWYTSIVPAYGNCVAYVCDQGGLHVLDLEDSWITTLVPCDCCS